MKSILTTLVMAATVALTGACLLLRADAVPKDHPRLFVQTLLPENPRVTLAQDAGLYTYDGQSFPPQRDTGPAPECRIEVSPPVAAAEDWFLHVLTAADANTDSVPMASAERTDKGVVVTVASLAAEFDAQTVSARVRIAGEWMSFLKRGTDADGDGMEDGWERARFGSADAVNGEAAADRDADGADNLAEYIADTDPTDARSRLVIRANHRNRTGMEIVWPSRVDRVYNVHKATDRLIRWPAEPLSGDLQGTGGTMTFSDPDLSGGSASYRVLVRIP